VPRGVKDRTLLVRAAVERLEQRHVPVTVPNVAGEADLTEDEVLEAMDGYRGRVAASLHAPSSHERDEVLVDHLPEDEPGFDRLFDLVTLAPAIAELDERDRRILNLRFGHDLSQREIGEELGVSQMHVSRLLRNVFDRLRTRLIP
jgi:RNA polymerase sigma-B factor